MNLSTLQAAARLHPQMDQPILEDDDLKSHIDALYTPAQLKKLFAHALLIDIDDNNVKVDIIKELLGDRFMELGPGTNRYGCLGPDGYCHKIAMDRRGIVDNMTEYKRSPELEWISPKVYETNGVVLIAENVELMTKEDFRANMSNILHICGMLAQHYIFTDIGYAMKNFCNWGWRRNSELVILDTGYLIPLRGNEDAMICPVCGGSRMLTYNKYYTGFNCPHCNTEFSFIDVYRRLQTHLDDQQFAEMTGFELPDFTNLNNSLYNNAMMQGGHIRHDIPSAATARDDGDDSPVRFEDIAEILRAQRQSGGPTPFTG